MVYVSAKEKTFAEPENAYCPPNFFTNYRGATPGVVLVSLSAFPQLVFRIARATVRKNLVGTRDLVRIYS